MTDAEYFALKALSKSQVKQWDAGYPKRFWDNCVFNPEYKPMELSNSMAFGKLSHAFVLTPNIVNQDFTINDDLGKSRTTKKWQEAQAKESKTIVTMAEVDHAQRMASALSQYEIIRDLLRGSIAEKPYTWIDPSWGPCKAKLDLIKNTAEGLYIIDYKTSSKVETNLRFIDSGAFQYDIGFYNRAAKAKFGKSLAKFIFIFQSTNEGEEHLIKIKSVSGNQLEACEIATDVAVQAILKRIAMWKEGDKTAWLANIQAEEWELSQWVDREIAKTQEEL